MLNDYFVPINGNGNGGGQKQKDAAASNLKQNMDREPSAMGDRAPNYRAARYYRKLYTLFGQFVICEFAVRISTR